MTGGRGRGRTGRAGEPAGRPARARPGGRVPAALSLRAGAALAALAALGGCRGEPEPTAVSEPPPTLEDAREAVTAPRAGRIGLRARVAYDDLEAIAREALPERRPERGSKRLCKRVLGMSVCGTARWDVVLARTGAPVLAADGDERVAVTLPLRVDGTVGVDGRVARALGLRTLELHGAVRVTARLALDLDDRWCPRVSLALDHLWTERPALDWAAGIDIDLTERLDAVIDDELERLPARLDEAIDCERFRARLGDYWRAHHLPLSIPGGADAWLDVVPTGFAFSGVRAERDALGVGFVLEATSVVQAAPGPDERPPLPPLARVAYAPGRTSVDLLIRADYARLDALAIPALVGRTFASDTLAGRTSVDVTSVVFSGNPDGVTVALGFVAELPATRRPTTGVLYLTARPVVDAALERVTLADVRLSRVVDDRLWRLVGQVFEEQIVRVIERRAVLELGERTAALERAIVEQLADPARTGGLVVRASDVEVGLVSLAAERAGLAAVARLEATLDVDVPLAVLERPLAPRGEDERP